jgi:RNA polymerase sigma-70 factor (ECF subfamily)
MHYNYQRDNTEAFILEEAAVITRMRSGSPDAFTEVILEYQTAIIRYLYRFTGDYELAQDLAQDTFVQAYKSILKTDSELQLKAWLYKIATNNALQHARRKKILFFIPFSSNKVDKTAVANYQADQTGEKLMIRQALGKVPPEQRNCLVLHYVEGFKYKEIAGILGISEEAVRKRTARGKEEFRKQYAGGENK